MSQIHIKTIIAVVAAIIMVSVAAQQQGFAFSDKYSASQRFDSGYWAGMNMCDDQSAVEHFKHTDEYRGHSDDYHHGFFSGSHNCQAADDVGANGNVIGGDNGNQGQSIPAHYSKINSNQYNRDQNQGQTNGQTSTCIGICYGSGPTSTQNQGLTN